MKRRDFFKIVTTGAAGVALGRLPSLAQAAAAGRGGLEAGDEPIRIGMSAPLSGENAALGIEFYRGAEAHWRELNAQGGVQGRAVEVVALDDGGDPFRTIANTIELLEEDRVQLLSNFVGEASVQRIAPMLERYRRDGVVLVGNLAGGRLKTRTDSVFHVRASYEQEVEAVVAGLWEQGVRRVGLYWQADASGKPAHMGLFDALARRGTEPVAELTYLPGRPVFSGREAFEHFYKADAEVVLFAVPSEVIAGVLAPAREMDWQGLGVLLSGVDATPLLANLMEMETEREIPYSQQLVRSQVVPSPLDTRFPLVARYGELMSKWEPEPPAGSEAGYRPRGLDAISLEGFLNARVIGRALSLSYRSGESLQATLESLEPYDVGLDQLVVLGGERRQALDQAYFTSSQKGRWEPLTSWASLAPQELAGKDAETSSTLTQAPNDGLVDVVSEEVNHG